MPNYSNFYKEIKNGISKLYWSLISVKLWAFAAFFIVSAVMVFNNLLTGEVWCSSNIAAYAMAFGLREWSKSKFGSSAPNSVEENK